MGEAGKVELSTERERALSDALAKQALAAKEGDDDVALTNLGNRIVDAIRQTAGKTLAAAKETGMFLSGLWGDVKDLGEAVDEKLDDVVGMVVDPIRRGFSEVGKDIRDGFGDDAQKLGFAIGAIYGMRDKIREGLTWLWNNMDIVLAEGWDLLTAGLEKGWELVKAVAPYIIEALVKLGNFIIGGLEKGWEWLKKVAPDIVDGLADIGDWLWEAAPDWLKSGLATAHKIVTFMGSLAANIGAFILDGLKSVLKFFGFDRLAAIVDSLSGVLHGLADFFHIKSEAELKAERTAISKEGAAEQKKVIMEAGGPAAEVYARAVKLGANPSIAARLSSFAETNMAATEVALKAFEASVESGMDVRKAGGVAERAFMESFKGRVTTVPKGVAAGAAGGAAGVAADLAVEARVAQQTRDAVREVANLQRRAIEADRSGGKPPESMDTQGSSDELGFGAYSVGRAGGGQI